MVLAAPPIRKTRVGGRSRRKADFGPGDRPVSARLPRGCNRHGYDFAQGRSNHLYSVAATTNAAGQVVERYSYNAYGVRTVRNSANAVISQSAVGQERGFTGYKTDNESGLYYARARMYSAKLGRFISRDPADYIDGLNEYQSYFVPNRLDPSGLWSWYDWLYQYRYGKGASIDLKTIGVFDLWKKANQGMINKTLSQVKLSAISRASGKCNSTGSFNGHGGFQTNNNQSGFSDTYGNKVSDGILGEIAPFPERDVLFAIGSSWIEYDYECDYAYFCHDCNYKCPDGKKSRWGTVNCRIKMKMRDSFNNPQDKGGVRNTPEIRQKNIENCMKNCIQNGGSTSDCADKCKKAYPETDTYGDPYSINSDWSETADSIFILEKCDGKW